MDKQFVFLNFHTEYSSKGTLEKRMCREYCFGDVFYHDLYQNNKYRIRIYKNLFGVDNGGKNNACFMTKDELSNYISIAKRIHDFKFKIENTDEEMFTVVLELDAPRIIHRYILTWIRYAYEYPFNFYLADAFKLKNTAGFRRDDIFNLFNLVGASCGYHFHGDHIHCIGDINWPRKFYSIKEQIEIVNKAKDNGEVNDLFPELDVNIKTIYDNDGNYREKFQALEYWNDPKEFKCRLKFYKENKDLIKKKKPIKKEKNNE